MGKIAHANVGNELSATEWEVNTLHTIDGTSSLEITRSNTYVIAASDSSAAGKAQADAKCDGTTDDVEIQAAIDALTGGGTIQLLEGTFNCDAINLASNITIRGMGRSTILNMNGAGIGQYPNKTLLYFSGVSNVELSDFKVTVSTSFPAYPDGYHVINYDVTSHDLVFRDLYLLGKSTTTAGDFGIIGRGYDVKIIDVLAEYFLRDFNFSEDSANVWLIRPIARYTPASADWSVVGIEIEDGVNGVHVIDAHVEDIESHIGQPGWGISVKTHAGKSANENIRIVRPTIINADNAAFYYSNTKDLVIEDMYVKDCSNVFNYHGSGGNMVGWKIRGGHVINTPINIITYWEDLTIDGLTVNTTTDANQSMYILGSGVAATIDNLKLLNLDIQDTNPLYTMHLRNINGFRIAGCTLDSIDQRAIRTSGDYLTNGIIESNDFRGNSIAVFTFGATDGSNVRIQNNQGYVTENWGTATLLNANTSITVAHGLSTTPTIVLITFAENPTNVIGDWWVDTLGTTNFVFNGVDPGASNLDFYWEAKVR